jgi:hypothetical protein
VVGSVAVLALPIALDPVRLGVNLLLVSRARPAQNLLVYWIGCVSASIVLLLVPLLALHFTSSPVIRDLANPATTAGSTVRHIETGLGVLVLAIAALMAVRLFVRRRSHTMTPQAEQATSVARLLQRGRDAPADGASVTQRLLKRAHDAWEGEALWVAAVIGFWAGPNPSLVMFSLTTILASGAMFTMQIGAAVVFIVTSLAVVEIVLISNLVAPAGTQAVLRRVHDAVGRYRSQLLIAILILVGAAFVAQGTGIL